MPSSSNTRTRLGAGPLELSRDCHSEFLFADAQGGCRAALRPGNQGLPLVENAASNRARFFVLIGKLYTRTTVTRKTKQVLKQEETA